ncbi:serine protease inhibitor ecotin [Tatumella terrea]|uniref:Ecotin family protein n=1 Tax=Tatumella terrea TaxID=419007 RepID=A0ABW1VYT0_9GAMM|nr:ecotin family protein [Tatumella sp. JGM118]MBS0908111.1 ecotin family protein [Tatumella sp. JGM118]
MRKFTWMMLLIPLTGTSLITQAATTDEDRVMKPYPLAEAHMQRNVILLPPLSNEQHYRVELIIGKKAMTDCNLVHLAGSMTEETAKGWGYPYYRVTLQPGLISTRRACIPAKKTSRLVTLPAASEKLLRYNSKLPLVVYAPQGIQVSYRLWKGGEDVVKSELR